MSPKDKDKLEEQLQQLKELYSTIAEAYAAMRDKVKNRDQVERLHQEIASQEARIKDFLVLIRAHELNSGTTMEICPNCHGAGALLIGDGEADECLLCNGVGAKVKHQKP